MNWLAFFEGPSGIWVCLKRQCCMKKLDVADDLLSAQGADRPESGGVQPRLSLVRVLDLSAARRAEVFKEEAPALHLGPLQCGRLTARFTQKAPDLLQLGLELSGFRHPGKCHPSLQTDFLSTAWNLLSSLALDRLLGHRRNFLQGLHRGASQSLLP